MTSVTNDDVQRLAMLSNLQLDDEEVASLTTDIGEILTYIEQLNDLDTDGVEPTYQVNGLVNVWREDAIEEGRVSGDKLVSLAADSEDNQVKVPKVL